MRTFASMAICILAAGAVNAFDSAEWLGKRALLLREAERLRAAYSNCLSKVNTPAEDVTIPIETHDDGSVKVAVAAKRAQFFQKDGIIWAEGVVITKKAPDGSQEMRVEAERCVVDRVTKSGWAEGRASFVQGGTKFGGYHVSTITSPWTLVLEDGMRSRMLFDGGYVSMSDNAYHFFLTDHVGSVRVVANSNGVAEEYNHYYPLGGLLPTRCPTARGGRRAPSRCTGAAGGRSRCLATARARTPGLRRTKAAAGSLRGGASASGSTPSRWKLTSRA